MKTYKKAFLGAVIGFSFLILTPLTVGAVTCTPTTNLTPNGTLTVAGDQYVTLSWSPVPGVTDYNVRLDDGTGDRYVDSRFPACTGNGGPSPHYYCVDKVPTTSISNIPVKAGRTYLFWVDPEYHPAADTYCNGQTTFAVPATQITYAPTVTLSANPSQINQGNTSILNWNSANATSCSASGGWSGNKVLSGSESVSPLSTTNYTITCANSVGQTVSAQTTVVVTTPTQMPTVDIKANGSDGPISVAYNSSATLSWNSTNATSCSVSPNGWTGTSGSQSDTITFSKTYSITCSNTRGSASDSVTVNVNQQPLPTVTIVANPAQINQGNSSTLTWSSTNATSCIAFGGWSGSQIISGSQSVSPSSTTIYAITCSNSTGQSSAQATVTVIAALTQNPTVTLTANPSNVNLGQSSVLSWSSTNATSCYASGAWSGTKSTSGLESTSSLTQQINTFYITCSGAGGTANAQTTVSVSSPMPNVNLSANPASINQGQSSVLSWNSNNATSCYGSGGWSGNKSLSGSESVSPTFTTTYVLTCTNNNGNTANDSKTVAVSAVINNILANNLQITKKVLNETLNQFVYSTLIDARGQDILSFEIKVKNVDVNTANINVKDFLPQELFYIPGTARVNGVQAPEGLTVSGLILNSVTPNEERTINFKATVFSGVSSGINITNQATATMNSGSMNAFATIQIRNRGVVLGAANIITGPGDIFPWILIVGFIGSIAFYVVSFKLKKIALVGGAEHTITTSENKKSPETKLILSKEEKDKQKLDEAYEYSPMEAMIAKFWGKDF